MELRFILQPLSHIGAYFLPFCRNDIKKPWSVMSFKQFSFNLRAFQAEIHSRIELS